MRKFFWCLLLATLPAHSQEGEVRLLTDDAIPRYLSRGQELARAEQWEKVVDVLHRVVIGDKEVFPDLKPEVLHSAVYSSDGRVFYPARELCLKELARLPPEGLRAYREAYDREARDLYARAEEAVGIEKKLAAYTEVYDKYLASTVGDDALENAGDLHLAVGRFYEALALFRRLIDLYPDDTDRNVPMIFAKAAYCAARIGDHEHRDVLLERLVSEHAGARLKIEGEVVFATDLRDHRLMEVSGGNLATTAPEDWPVAGGNATRARLAEELPDDLPRTPFWSFRLNERDPTLRAIYGSWLVFLHDRAPSVNPDLDGPQKEMCSPYPTVRPVVHDGLVLYKDYLEIVARRASSGALVSLRGRYDNPDEPANPEYLHPVADVRPRPNDSLASKYEWAYRFLDYGGNSLVVGGDKILTMEQSTPPSNLLTASKAQSGPPNTIVAYSRREGKTVWAWHQDLYSAAVAGDEAAYKAWRADYEEHQTPVFQGPGVVSGRLLYTLATERDDLAGVSLWAFDVETGVVRFRTPLHYPDEVDRWLPRGAALAVAGGVVYVVSQSGVVAAVDALPPGRVRWITRYGRNLQRSRNVGRRRGRRGRRTMVAQGFAYNDPVVASGKVFVAAADGNELVALDAESGRVAWAIPRKNLGRLYQVMGVVDGVLVVAGDKVMGIDAAKGERLWGPVDLDGWSHGRGVLGAKYAYVPTNHDGARRSMVERIDVRTGEKLPNLEFDVEKLGNLVISGGRLIAANGDEIMCFTTREREIERIDAKLAAATRKRELLFERALLSLTGPNVDRQAARADFERALAAATAEGEDLLLRANAIENLFAMALDENDLGALSEARALVEPLARLKRPGDEVPRHRAYLAQLALLEAQILGRSGRGEDALVALEKFLDEHGHDRVVVSNRVVEAAAAANEVRSELMANNAGFREAFAESVRARIRAALARGDKAALEQIPDRYGNLPPSEEASFALCDLLEGEKDHARAEIVLRRFIDNFGSHPRRAHAHLRLARLLARTGLLGEARRERAEGLSRLDEGGRVAHATLIAELEKMLPSAEPPAVTPSIRIPLSPTPLARAGTPVSVSGAAARDLKLYAGVAGYEAYDADGKLLWKQPYPAGAVTPGPVGDPLTTVVAAEIARARLARTVGDDLVLADVGGVLRLEARTGKVKWRYPRAAEHAATETQRSLTLLRAELEERRKKGAGLRSHPLPAYALAGERLVRALPRNGVEALDVATGETVWLDGPVAGAPVGPPAALGQLVAVGWTKPGRARVYHLVTGEKISEHVVKPKGFAAGVLAAPPVLDPLGRLLLVTAGDENGAGAALQFLDARTLAPARPPAPVVSTNAMVLHADGALVVLHDGGSAGAGTENLHFLDLKAGARVSRRCRTLLRDVQVLRDGYRLFVFTHDPGLEDTGARLFRVDLKGSNVLSYGLPPRALAYGRPVLTRNYLIAVAATARSAHVRVYDREASADSGAPQAVFLLDGGRETAEFDVTPGETTRYEIPPAVAVRGSGLVVGHPFGIALLQARDTR